MSDAELIAAAGAAGAAATGVATSLFRWKLGSKRLDQAMVLKVFEQMKEELDRVQESRDALDRKVTAQSNEIAELRGQITVLTTQAIEHERTVTENVALRAEVSSLKDWITRHQAVCDLPTSPNGRRASDAI